MFPPGKSGGLIEARPAWAASSACSWSFRRVNPAASLKRHGEAIGFSIQDGFRRVNPAASLKRSQGQRQVDHRGQFPPGKSGGLIEAWHRSVSGAAFGTRFPPGKSGGLIEAES